MPMPFILVMVSCQGILILPAGAKKAIIFIGPAAETMEAMGDKIAARKRMIAAGVPVIPGTEQPLQSAEEAVRIVMKIGYPVMLKASMGGGGKGIELMRG